MRIFTTTETCDECEKGSVTLYEIDAGRLIDMVKTHLEDLRLEDKTDPFLIRLMVDCVSVVE